MALDLKEIKYDEIGYKVTNFKITVNNKGGNLIQEKLLKDINIQSFYIEKDFDNDYLPIFMVSISMDDKLYKNIIKYQDTTIFNIVIKSGKYDNNENTISKLSVFLSGNFSPRIADNTPFVTESEYKKESETYHGGESMSTIGKFRTFILVKKNTLKSTRKIINNVITSANMTDTISYLLCTAGISNVLMSKLDNSSSYKEIILLPIPLTSQLSYLDSVFGFYKEGSQIFFDFDKAYILRNSHKCTAFVQHEIKTVIVCVYSASGGKSMVQGLYVDRPDETAYLSCNTNTFSVVSNSNVSETYTSPNNLIINQNGQVVETSSTQGGSYNVINTSTHNKYYSNEAKLRLLELEDSVNVIVSNIDVSLLQPNKLFKVRSTVTKVTQQVNHKYRLASWSAPFAKEGSIFKPVVTLSLKKTED